MKLLGVLLLFWVVSANGVTEYCGTSDKEYWPVETTPAADTNQFFNPYLIVMLDDQNQYRIWDDSQKHNLTYCISDRFGKHKKVMVDAVVEATREWEKYANVTFIYKPEEDKNCTPKNSNVLFRIDLKNSRRTRYRARAFFPGDEQKKRTVFYKKKHIKDSPNDLVRLSLHELGHVLGFRHEHIHPETVRDCKELNPFEPITDYDIESIMHYPLCGGKNRTGGLSAKDKEGAGILYPF